MMVRDPATGPGPRDDHGAASPYDVFRPDGRWLGTLVLPARFTPTHIGAAFVIGIHRDRLDIEHVQRWGLDRTGGD